MKAEMIPGVESLRDYMDDIERLVKMVDQTCSTEMQALLCKAVQVILFENLYPARLPSFMPIV